METGHLTSHKIEQEADHLIMIASMGGFPVSRDVARRAVVISEAKPVRQYGQVREEVRQKLGVRD